ncbi:hypothetical protein [Bosea lathyri]|uniref:hypothetical protein n=1 Tax=Bosea lathyri TaxID=1036778 RepID=UPI000CDE795B|nr:hypothetical protein [Bosea lathyri]
MSFWRFPPPPSQRISARLPGTVCSFCGSDEDVASQFWTGRVISIQHQRKTICEACIEYADELTQCARLARHAPKAKPGPFRRIQRPAIGRAL